MPRYGVCCYRGGMLPYSEACERNQGPILAILREALASTATVLEIGSGTGQHAVHFSQALPHVDWQPSDRSEWLSGVSARCGAEGGSNIRAPIALDVDGEWPRCVFDAVFSANTLHIMGWPQVEAFFAGVGRVLRPGGRLMVYGPFRYRDDYTSASNAAFDRQLRLRDPASGIRDFEAVDALAMAQGLQLAADHSMPANNQLLVWWATAR